MQLVVRSLPGLGKFTTTLAAARELRKAGKLQEVMIVDVGRDINTLQNK